jgi:aminoglycoside 6'-N-acetyltransferase I
MQFEATVRVVDLTSRSEALHDAAAQMLVSEFAAPSGWPDSESARAEVTRVLREGFARAALDGEQLVGWIGALPEYHGRVWELHPLVVRREHRRRGIGRILVAALEQEVRARGGLTITLGTDDDAGMTSLADVDLYTDVPGHLRELRDLGRGHPFLFYRRLGFVVTGVMPDANGPGRPDIYMSKRVSDGAASITSSNSPAQRPRRTPSWSP